MLLTSQLTKSTNSMLLTSQLTKSTKSVAPARIFNTRDSKLFVTSSHDRASIVVSSIVVSSIKNTEAMMSKSRQRRKRRTAGASLLLFFMSHCGVVHCFVPSECRSLPWRPPTWRMASCRSEYTGRHGKISRRCPFQDPDWRYHFMTKEGSYSPESLEKTTIMSESMDIPLLDLDQIDLDVILEDETDVDIPDMHEILDMNTSEAPSDSTLPVISLENIDLLTKSGNIAYFYLKNEIGMSEEAMWKITFEAGPVLGMAASTLRRKVDLLQRTMDLSDENVQTILERQPTILQLSADQNLAPTILLLVRALDLSKADLRDLVVQFPCILCYSTKNLKSKLSFFISLMGYSREECRKLLLSEPKLLTASVKTGLLPHLRFFTSDIEIPVEKLRTIIKKNPRLLLYSLEDNLVPKLIFYLTLNLCMNSKQVLRLLTKYPQFLDYNLNDHTLPITAYLMQELEFQPTEVRQLLLSFPRLVTHSLQKIKHVVGYLRFELGLGAAQVKRVLYQAPQAIGLNTDGNLKKKVAFLRDTFQLNDDELRRVIAGMPTLLICSIENNLQPKTDYLKKVFGNEKDLCEAILTMPALLGYSLEKRIKPRMERLLAIGGQPRGITIGIPMKDDAFDEWLKGRQKRLQKNPGFDSKVKSREIAESAAIVHVSKRKEEEGGRIVHWKRERRPPPQRMP